MKKVSIPIWVSFPRTFFYRFPMAILSAMLSKWSAYMRCHWLAFLLQLEPVKFRIAIVQRHFIGGEEIEQNGNFVKDQRGSEYIGPPSPKVDAAWNRLLLGTCLAVKLRARAMLSRWAHQTQGGIWSADGCYKKAWISIYPVTRTRSWLGKRINGRNLDHTLLV
jgi:hypothetical protein